MVLAGVKSGQLRQGHFNASQYNYLEARTIESYLLELHFTPHSGHRVDAGLPAPGTTDRQGKHESSGSRGRGRH